MLNYHRPPSDDRGRGMNQMDANAGGAGDGQASAMTQAAQEAVATGHESCEAQLAEVRREADDFKNRYLRAAADAANIRKQAERDAAARLAEEKRRFLRDFLDVADNLEMALALG